MDRGKAKGRKLGIILCSSSIAETLNVRTAKIVTKAGDMMTAEPGED